jgi:hypothetical protein
MLWENYSNETEGPLGYGQPGVERAMELEFSLRMLEFTE